MREGVVNVVIAGLGGQGVLTASDIVAAAAFLAGLDVKKSEVHGMSQRGGSVSSDVRFGTGVLSPMIPAGEVEFLLVLAPDQVENNRPGLRPGGTLIPPDAVNAEALPGKRSLNLALLGCLSRCLDLPESAWHEAVEAAFPDSVRESNWQAFLLGRSPAR